MSGWTLERAAEMCGGRLDGISPPGTVCPFGGVSIDTRTIEAGSIFVAVRGARDGHAFLGDAAARGAIGALVEDRDDLPRPAPLPLIRVPATVEAMQRWAAAHRASLPATVIAVTGSSGKTTTKDRLAEILAARDPTHRTAGNLNNHLGVPITLLGMRPEHRWAVVEIAMNHPGEIAPLSRICQPDHAVLTTVGWAHIGAFPNRDAILREKLEILAGLKPGGQFFHEADPWTIERLPASARDLRRRTFGMSEAADCAPVDLAWGPRGTRFTTSLTGQVAYACPGPGALLSALAAILVARTLGIAGPTIVRSLEAARPRPMRMEPLPLAGGTALLDCYNASPESSLAAVRFLGDLPDAGRRWLAFGEMRELGGESAPAHRRVGAAAAALDGIFALGDDCAPLLDGYRSAGGRGPALLCGTHEEIAERLMDRFSGDDIALFKGSRASEMERAYEICARGPTSGRGASGAL